MKTWNDPKDFDYDEELRKSEEAEMQRRRDAIAAGRAQREEETIKALNVAAGLNESKKTHKEIIQAVLENAKIKYDVENYISTDTAFVITDGFAGFYSSIIFNAEGTLIRIAAYE